MLASSRTPRLPKKNNVGKPNKNVRKGALERDGRRSRTNAPCSALALAILVPASEPAIRSRVSLAAAFGSPLSPYYTVRRQAYRGRVLQRLKTTNAHRVDGCSPRRSGSLGCLYRQSSGLALSNKHRQSAQPFECEKPHVVSDSQGIGCRTGFHGFRRFRATHLRKQGAPDSLIKAWLGHSANSSATKWMSELRRDNVRVRPR